MSSEYPDTLQAHLKPAHTLGTKAAGCMLVNTWQQWRPVAPLTALLKGAVSYSTHSASASAKKPPISQRVRFIDWLRVVARGGQGGGGSSALFGRTGMNTCFQQRNRALISYQCPSPAVTLAYIRSVCSSETFTHGWQEHVAASHPPLTHKPKHHLA